MIAHDHPSIIERMKAAWVQTFKRDVMTLWFALGHPLTPWYVRVLAALLTAYALSPVDLIPDFIPVLGYLDDLIVVPLGVWLLMRIVPAPVVLDSRARAEQWFLGKKAKPRSMAGLALIVSLWGLSAWVFYRLVFD